MNAREEILARIRQAHAAAPPAAPALDAVDRSYRDQPNRSNPDLVELLTDRLLDYRASVRHCAPAELAATIAAAVAERSLAAVVVPDGLPPEWLAGVSAPVRRDGPGAPLPVAELDRTAGVITGCAVAAAETGTLVLDAAPDQGRRAITLIPDYHLCVVGAGAIEPDIPEALARLDPDRPLTFISGPSATSDIELTRVEGVHGPRTLEVIIVGAAG